MQTRRLTLLAVLLAVSVVLNIIERTTMQALTQPLALLLGPIVGAGGVRIGLANVVVMTILFTYGIKDGFVVLMLRILIVGIATGTLGFIPFWSSLMGGLVAFFLMVIFKQMKGFTLISVSVMGAVGHVFGQIFVAIIFFQIIEIVIYVPFMLMIAVPAGIFTGKLTIKMLEYLKPFLSTDLS